MKSSQSYDSEILDFGLQLVSFREEEEEDFPQGV